MLLIFKMTVFFRKLYKSLGLAGDIEAETEGLLLANDVDTREFSAAALSSLPITEAVQWRIDEVCFSFSPFFVDFSQILGFFGFPDFKILQFGFKFQANHIALTKFFNRIFSFLLLMRWMKPSNEG